MDFIDKRLRTLRIILAALLLGYSAGSLLLRDEKLMSSLSLKEKDDANNEPDNEDNARQSGSKRSRSRARTSASS